MVLQGFHASARLRDAALEHGVPLEAAEIQFPFRPPASERAWSDPDAALTQRRARGRFTLGG